MSLWNEAWADPSERFGRPYDQKTVIGKTVRNFIKELLAVGQGEVNGDISAEDYIEFSQTNERQHKIQLFKLNHGPDFILDGPRVSKHGKIFLQFVAGKAALHLKFVVFSPACLSNGAIRDVCSQEFYGVVGQVGQQFFDNDGNGIEFLPRGRGGAPDFDVGFQGWGTRRPGINEFWKEFELKKFKRSFVSKKEGFIG